MKKMLFLWLGIITIISCQKNEDLLDTIEEEKVLEKKEQKTTSAMEHWKWLSVSDSIQVSLEEAKQEALATAYHFQKVEKNYSFSRFSPIEIEEVKILSNPKKNLFSREESKADFYLVNFTNGNGYALVSADKRVPGVMAYNSSGKLDNTNNPGRAIMFSAIQNYMEVQKALYEEKKDSLKQIAIEEIKNHFKIHKDSISNNNANKRVNERRYCSLDDFYITDDLLKDAPWIVSKQKNPLLKTIWYQSNFYNDLVPLICNGDEAPVGCVAIAVGQIMAYHKKPSVFKGREMHWEDMTRIDNGRTFSEIEQTNPTAMRDIQHLLARLGDSDLLKMYYECDGSSSNIDNANRVLKVLGYNTNNVENFSENTVAYNILANRPLYIRGCDTSGRGCHAWVLDGYIEKGRKTLRHIYSRCPAFHKDIEKLEGYITEEFVHCNFGWGENDLGWYRMGVFDTSKRINSFPSNSHFNFQNLKIISNIY